MTTMSGRHDCACKVVLPGLIEKLLKKAVRRIDRHMVDFRPVSAVKSCDGRCSIVWRWQPGINPEYMSIHIIGAVLHVVFSVLLNR